MFQNFIIHFIVFEIKEGQKNKTEMNIRGGGIFMDNFSGWVI
jgi:hypothetical protein